MLESYSLKLLSLLKDSYIFVGGLIVSFFTPIAAIIFTAISLGIVDLIIRLTAVYKKEGLEAIQSAKIYATVQKLIMYSLLIIMMYIIDIIFLQELRVNLLDHIVNKGTLDATSKIKLSSLVSFVIVIREIKSIDENWKYALGWSFLETAEEIIIKLKSLTKNARKKSIN